jgi:wyosine [tRNA(Phe)-imidazoG37] synthetase (radical SAM superfamily)
MLVRGLNDTEEALRDIAAVLCVVQPDEVHISLPTRPPAETWVQPPDNEGLLRARAILGGIARVIYSVEGEFDLGGYGNLADAVVGIITRHPMREEELVETLARRAPGGVRQTLKELEASGRAQVVERYGVRFWSAAAARYPDQAHSLRAAPERHRQ